MLIPREATRMSWYQVTKNVTKGLRSRPTFEWTNLERWQTCALEPVLLRRQT